jgi:hypothetical protein
MGDSQNLEIDISLTNSEPQESMNMGENSQNGQNQNLKLEIKKFKLQDRLDRKYKGKISKISQRKN